MKTRIHLVSMPWADHRCAPIQLSALGGYVTQQFGDKVKIFECSLFAAIQLQNIMDDDECFNRLKEYEEYPYFIICAERFLRKKTRIKPDEMKGFIKKINKAYLNESLLTKAKMRGLENQTKRFIDEKIAPKLSKSEINIVGFSLNYYQVYSSVYCAKYLEEKYPDYKILCVFGGASTSQPNVLDAVRNFGVEGVFVVGEGEVKLAEIAKKSLEMKTFDKHSLIQNITSIDPSVFSIQANTTNLMQQNFSFQSTQVKKIESLPPVNYDEYFRTTASVLGSKKSIESFKAVVTLPMEGTRGCFAKCDFCNFNIAWEGFRKKSSRTVLEEALNLQDRYLIDKVHFFDNVCDTWAEEYADSLIARRQKIPSFMELRAHHPEQFWTKLSLSGVEKIQIGVESLAPGLLKKMNKGTTVKQNILVQKWLKELGILSTSNLISHHPKSTMKDIADTKRYLSSLVHLDKFAVSYFGVSIKSPIYDSLKSEEKESLKERNWVKVPRVLAPYAALQWRFELPKRLLNKKVFKAWDEFYIDYHQFVASLPKTPTLTVQKYGPNSYYISDRRFGEMVEYYLNDEEAQIYSFCHSGPRVELIETKLNIPKDKVQKILNRFVRQNIMIKVDGSYISIALRPRDELLNNYFQLAKTTKVSVKEQHKELTASVDQVDSSFSV